MFRAERHPIKKILVGLIIVLWASACYSREDLPQSSPTPTVTRSRLMLYQTLTPKPSEKTPTRVPTSTPPPSPTATPYLYTIEQGDTLLGISFRFGLTLDELLAANPSIDPQFLPIGSDINIPLFGDPSDGINEATPVPVVFEKPIPHCYTDADGGAWCFLPVRNDLETAVENLTALFTFYNENGKSFREEVAVSPLNLIKPGSRIPLVLYLDPPLKSIFSASAQVLTSLPVAVEDTRYLPATIGQMDVDILPDGKSARVSGFVQLDSPARIEGIGADRLVWVLAVAFGEDGNVVGFRRWEYVGPIDENRTLPFEIFVYSVGPAIEKLEVNVEVQS